MLFDELLKILGELGHYQKTRLFLICLVSIVCAFHAMNMVFVGANPKKKCEIPPVNLSSAENVTLEEWKSFLRSADEDACEIYNPDEVYVSVRNGSYTFQELTSAGKKNVTFSKVQCSEWQFSRDVYGSTIVTQFYLVCDSAWLRSTSKTLYFFGRLLGAVVFGQLSDIFGRRPMFFAGLLMLLIVGCVAAASPSMLVFIPFYILQGAAQTGLFLVAYTMCTELVGPSYRVLAGFLIQGFYSIGYMALSAVAYLIYDWRYIELAITVPVVLFAAYLCVLPESIRWLLSKGRIDEAKDIIKKVAETNKVSITEEMLEDLNSSCQKQKEATLDDRKYTFVDLFRPFRMLILSLNVWFNWLVNAMVYYGLALGTDNLGGDPYINFMIAGAVEIPAYIMCVLLLNRVGRKKPLTITMIFGGISCIASAFVPKDLVALKITLAMLGKFGITASYAIIYLMAAEVFPTVVRNIGMGISSMSARIGGMLAPQILELQVFWDPLPLLLFGALSSVAGGLALFLPETNGRPLPQTIEDVTHPEKLKHRDEMTLEISSNGTTKERRNDSC